MTNSRQKGKRGERLAVKLFRSYGFTARRGQQHRGGPDSPDIIVDELLAWHFEIKQGYKYPDPEGWMEQALKERGPFSFIESPRQGCPISHTKQIPCVLWKPARAPWVAYLRASLHPIDLVDWCPPYGQAQEILLEAEQGGDGGVTFDCGLVSFDASYLLEALKAKHLPV